MGTSNGRGGMWCIVLPCWLSMKQEGQNYAKYIRNYCTEKKVFPLIEIYQNQEQFLNRYRKQCRQWCFLHCLECPG